MVYLFGLKREVVNPQFRWARNRRSHKDQYQELEIGLPLDWGLEAINMAIILDSRNPVKSPTGPEDIPAEIRFQYGDLAA